MPRNPRRASHLTPRQRARAWRDAPMLCGLVLWLASGQACTSRSVVPEFQCRFDSECAGALVCAAGFCRAPCRSDRDCALGTRCVASDQPGGRVCLPPEAPALCTGDGRGTCSEGYLCGTDRQCHARCSNDGDCRDYSPGSCDSRSGMCVGSMTVGTTPRPLEDTGPGDLPDVTDPPDIADLPDAADPRDAADTSDMGGETDRPDACQTPDQDRDGHPSRACGGDDCDDLNPRAFPGAMELCTPADEDCDGDPYDLSPTMCRPASVSACGFCSGDPGSDRLPRGTQRCEGSCSPGPCAAPPGEWLRLVATDGSLQHESPCGSAMGTEWHVDQGAPAECRALRGPRQALPPGAYTGQVRLRSQGMRPTTARVHLAGASGRLVGVPAGALLYRGVSLPAGASTTVTIPFRVMSAACEVTSFEVYNPSSEDGAFFITDVALQRTGD